MHSATPIQRRLFNLAVILALMLASLSVVGVRLAQAISTTVVISEFRVRGPNGGSDEFIDLYNLSSSPVNVGGWKVKGSNAAGTIGTRATIPTGTILGPGCHYLLTNSSMSGGPYSGLVPGDQTYTTGITDDGGIAVTLANDTIVDQVGMSAGSAFKEGTPLASLGSSNLNRSYERKPGGLSSTIDTDNNSSDFQLISPSNPQNRTSTCLGGVGAANPPAILVGGSTLLTVAVTPGTNPPSTGLTVTSDLTPIGGSAAQPFFDNGTNGDVTAGDNVFSYLATATIPTACGASLSATITDAQSRQGSASITLSVEQTAAVHDIQGASHISPFNGLCLKEVSGVVTAKRSNGFYMQDPNPDGDDATSEGIFVFTSSAPAVSVSQAVQVRGSVIEFRPGGSSSTNLTITQLGNPGLVITLLSSDNPLPAPTVIGSGGRIPPSTVIEDDVVGSVETSGVFDPANDGIDFYESLEGMLVQVNDAVAVGPWRSFGSNREIPVVGDNGAAASLRTNRGGVVIQPGDFNPERIILNDLIAGGPTLPPVSVGDSFPGATIGVMDYSFGNFKLQVITLASVAFSGLARETTQSPVDGELAVATFNVENLSPNDPQTKFDELADLIVNNLQAPDIVALEEMQDNDGTSGGTGSPVVDANVTFDRLIAAIVTAGGPTYDYQQINPVDDAEGGAPGGNIRVGFLFRTDRGLSFVDRPGGDSVTPTTVLGSGPTTRLSLSPGRVDPLDSAWSTPEGTRRSLAGEFTFAGHTVFVIANHWKSKSGDQPLFGRFQPPFLTTEAQRILQAQSINDFVDSLLAADPNAKVIVLGDLNDFQFSTALATLKGSVLTDLIETLLPEERYSYVFDGNSQTLDHILATGSLLAPPIEHEYDVVHVNSEFWDQVSDHEPQVARFCLDTTLPTITASVSPDSLWPANHKYFTVNATVTITDDSDPNPALTVSVTSNEPDDGLGDGDTPNDIVIEDDFTFKLRAERSGTGSGRVYTITYTATDSCGNATTVSVTVTVPHSQGN
jgi:predicted extracellular nuclease